MVDDASQNESEDDIAEDEAAESSGPAEIEVLVNDDNQIVITSSDKIETIEAFLKANAANDKLAAGAERMTPADMLTIGMRAMEHDLADLEKLRNELSAEYKTESTAASKLAGYIVRLLGER